MNKKFFMIVLCCSLAVLMCCCLSVYGALNLKCPSCGSTRVRTYTQSSANGHVATTVCNNCETVVLRGTVVAHKWNTYHVCTVCGYKGSHSYSAKITKYPTCSSQGVRTYSCVCGASYTKPIDVLDHKFSYQGGTKDANNHLLKCQNCSATRNEKHTYNSSGVCSVCGYKDSIAPAECDHNYLWYPVNFSTHKYACEKCGKIKETQKHQIESFAGGSYERCTLCGLNFVSGQDTYTDLRCKNSSHKKEYSYAYNSDRSVDPFYHLETCTLDYIVEEKLHTYNSSNKCTKCGFKNTNSNCSHEDSTKATCTSAGVCNDCGEVVEKALGHHYVFDEKNGSTITNERHILVCDRCYKITKTELHSLDINKKCRVCGYVRTAETCPHTSCSAATCLTGKKCKDCETEIGEPLGHVWKEATCTTPKTCTRCKATEGKALGHNYIYDEKATKKSQNPDIHYFKCINCNGSKSEFHKIVDGECEVCGYKDTCAHNWKEATCTAPKTCTKCKTTEGKALGHSYIYNKDITNKKGNNRYHYLKCERCGDEKRENHTSLTKCTVCGYLKSCSHVWKEATCTAPKTCTKCGITEGEKLDHEFVYTSGTKTEKTHVLNCKNKGCTETKEEDHIYTSSETVCDVCKYEKKIQECNLFNPHQYGYFIEDNDYHAYRCIKCGKKELVEHNFNMNPSGYEECRDCHLKRIPTISNSMCTNSKHNKKYSLIDDNGNIDKYYHKMTCLDPSHGFSVQEKHSFNSSSGKCVCGFECPHTNRVEPTCNKTGRCRACGKTLEKTEHNFIYNGGTKTQKTHKLSCANANCKATQSEDHQMENNECKICGYICAHNYRYDKDVTKEKGDNKYHYVKCRKCNDIKAEEHTSGEKCSVCNRKKEVIPECEPSKHNYKYTPTSDGSEHIAECTVCGKTETQEHVMGTDALNNDRCTACGLVYFDSTKGYTNPCNHPKKYSILYNSDRSIDNKYHLMMCTDPKDTYVAEVEHEFDANTGRCTKCYVSKKCSKDYTAPGHPVYILQYEKLGENSSNLDKVHLVVKRCSACNVTFNYLEDHSYNINGVCICGYENVGAQKCTVDRTIEGHNPVLTGNSTIVNYKEHRLYYYCNLCNRTFGKNEAHNYNEAGICSCGARQDNFLCEHDPENYVPDGYDKSDDINKHIRKITCKTCNAHAELREDHEFTDKKTCAKCGAEFVMKIKTNRTSLIPGEGTQVSITHNGDENVTFKYESSNTNLFEVDNNGIVKALEDTNTKATKATITVKAYSGSGTELASEKFDMKYETKSKYTLTVDIPLQAYLGEETTLRAIASAELGDKDGIKWIINGSIVNQPKDSNSIKHIFNKLGKVQCEVTLSINNTTVTETRTVEVIERKTMLPAESMSILLDESRKILNVESLTIISGNSVIVSGNIVTAVELGTTTLKDEKGNTYNINVTNKIIPVTDVKIDLGRNYDKIFVGEEVQANIIITPSNTTDEVTITSTNTNVASVTNAGLIKANKEGKTTIKVVTSSGEFKKEIEVKQENLKLTTPTTIQLGVTEKNYKVKIDETLLSPKTLATLKCVGNNASVAIVSESGVVSAQANGSITVKISVTLLNGKTKETTLKINVSDSTRATVGSTKYDKKEGINENSNKVYIYFGGSGAAKSGINASDNKNIKGTTYQDTVIVPILKGNTDSWANWNEVVRDMEILLQSEEYAGKEIVLVGYSSGGYPAAELALALAKEGRAENVTLNVVDGVQGNGVKDCIARYDKLDEAGVNTTIYGSNGSREISSRTRAVGETFATKEASNIHYEKVDLDHGEIQDYAQDLLTK